MEEVALKILLGIAMKFFTETFFSKLIGHSALVLAKSTKNTLTKEVATDVAGALGVTKLEAQSESDDTKAAS